ncbi:GH25 family lysozyme [Streptomyces sp. NPDC047046]|uniref:GH25 family lysozyme n=1 Tax=Streptomyces sp. NPDC047046 TaxID=3155378 RepID=UPI0033EB6ABC
MTITGIDVSSYQPTDYSTAGHAFVFVKATEGTTYTNPRMAAQAKRARDAGCVVGFYHFLRPGSMTAQAEYFVEQAASIAGDVLWADWEDAGVSCADKDAFLAEVKRLRGATHRVGLYCNRDFWLNRDTTSGAGDALWIADYNGKPGKPGIKAVWKFHQYTDRPLDTSRAAFKDRAELRAWATRSTAPKPSAPAKATPKPSSTGSTTYTVKSGDTLSDVAARHGVTLSALLAANPSYKAHPNTVYPGARLALPAKAKASTSSTTYTVRPGDTLSAIAAKHGTTVARLAADNHISNPNVIRAGARLTIRK